MKSMKSLCFLSLFLLLSFISPPLCHAADAAPKNVSITQWRYNRIWKSAAKQKAHFFECVLDIENGSGDPLKSVSYVLSFKDAKGETLTQSDKVRVGFLKSMAKKSKEFDVPRAFEFSEVLLEVSYKCNGEKFTESFVAGWEQAFARAMSNAGGDESRLEVRTIGHDILFADELAALSTYKEKKKRNSFKRKKTPTKKKKKKKRNSFKRKKSKKSRVKKQEAFLNVRLKNLYNKPATGIEAIVVFTYDDKSKSEDIVVKIVDSIDPGATHQAQRISLGERKPFMSYSLGVKANFGEGFQGTGPALIIGDLSFADPSMDKANNTINMNVTNKGGAASKETLEISLILKTDAGVTVKELTAILEKGIAPAGIKTIRFKVDAPVEWFSYELSTLTK